MRFPLLLVVLLLETLLVPFGADRGLLLLTLLCLCVVLVGFTVAIAVARRDIGFIDQPDAHKRKGRPQAPQS